MRNKVENLISCFFHIILKHILAQLRYILLLSTLGKKVNESHFISTDNFK